LDGDNWVF
jgi:hypothetical protein